MFTLRGNKTNVVVYKCLYLRQPYTQKGRLFIVFLTKVFLSPFSPTPPNLKINVKFSDTLKATFIICHKNHVK